jgi:transposase
MSRREYAADLSDKDWLLVGPLIPAAKPGGRPREQDMREILNGHLLSSSRWLCLAFAAARIPWLANTL